MKYLFLFIYLRPQGWNDYRDNKSYEKNYDLYTTYYSIFRQRIPVVLNNKQGDSYISF